MLFPKGLVVSLPSHQLRKAALPSSMFDLHSLEHIDRLESDLLSAIHLIVGFCSLLGCQLRFIHRPEIFTHGETLSWLTDRLDGIEDHLNISDGTTVKLLPGMRNHLFFYLHERYGSVHAFERFLARAPETFSQITFQVNTTFSFMYGRTLHRPQTILIQAERYRIAAPLELRRFYLNHHSVADSAARSASLPGVGAEVLKEAPEVLLVAFTNNAANDKPFCRIVAEMIVKRLDFPKKNLLVLATPPPQVENEDFLIRLSRLLESIRNAGTVLPRAALSNTLIASAIPDESILGTLMGNRTLVIPDSFDAWRYPRSFWTAFSKVTLVVPRFRRRDKAPLMTLLTDIMGSPPDLVWTTSKVQGSIYSRIGHD